MSRGNLKDSKLTKEVREVKIVKELFNLFIENNSKTIRKQTEECRKLQQIE